jgi:hypothetical protein
MSKPAVFLAVIFIAWNESTGHAQSPKRIEIIAKGLTYDPDTITLKKGEPVVRMVAPSAGSILKFRNARWVLGSPKVVASVTRNS